MGKLAISLGSLPICAVEIGEDPSRIGRTSDNDVVLPLPDVADSHAEISSSGDSCEVRAMSGETMYFRGRRVTRARLAPGDHLGLGGYRLQWLGDGVGLELAGLETTFETARSHGTKPLEPPDLNLGRATELAVVEGADKGANLLLEAVVSTVGRSPDCDLVLADDSVSWRHISLELTRDGIRVRDLGSRNGTLLDGRRVESALAGEGARIQIGKSVLKIADGGAKAERAESGLAELVGNSAAMQTVYRLIEETAATRLPVLVSGETGTGKELVARAIHTLGPRSTGPFVPVNCAAIPRDMLEDELFGHVKGAFTGATSDRQGAFERAGGGTIFLDEVGELALDLQAKLLRVLEDREIPRLGGDPIHSDFRVVAATGQDLTAAVSDGGFRQDLFFRLVVTEIRVPPLRERPDDLPALVRHFLALAEAESGLETAGQFSVDDAVIAVLSRHAWPGNVRELRNVVFRLLVASEREAVEPGLVQRLLSEVGLRPSSPREEPETLEQMEKEVIRRALDDCGGQKRAAARRLGIAESTLYEKIRRYNLR